jgi:hypothetical protein
MTGHCYNYYLPPLRMPKYNSCKERANVSPCSEGDPIAVAVTTFRFDLDSIDMPAIDFLAGELDTSLRHMARDSGKFDAIERILRRGASYVIDGNQLSTCHPTEERIPLASEH